MEINKSLIPVLVLAAITYIGAGARPPQETGTFETLLTEDFSLFSKGSESIPDAVSIIEDGKVYGNIPDDLTKTPGWRGAMVYQAGGCAYIGIYQATMQKITGMVITPRIDISNTESYFLISARTRLASEKSDKLEVAMNYGEGSGVDLKMIPITDEWSTIETTMSSDVNISQIYFTFNSSKYEMLLDDIKIELFTPYLAAPKALPATDYDGTSFIAHWKEVNEAESYLLSVFHYNSDGERVYLFSEKKVDGTEYKVEGLDPNITYSYAVKAVNAKYTSPESALILVKGVSAPIMKEPQEASDNGFSTSWDTVPFATHYEFWAYTHHVASSPEDYKVIEEKFSKIRSSGTVQNPETIMDVAEEYLDEYMSQPGWTLAAPLHIDGAVGMNSEYYLSGLPCYLMSPVYDLSQNGGEATISFRMWISDTSASGHQTQAVVSMLNDLGGGTPETVDQFIIEDFKTERWNDVTVTLKNGTNTGRIMIFPYGNTGYLFVDNLKIIKSLASGDSFMNPVYSKLITDTGITVNAKKNTEDCWAYRARSYRVEGDIVLSDWSEYMHSNPDHLKEGSSISDTIDTDAINISTASGTLTVNNNGTDRISICDIYGRIIAYVDASKSISISAQPGVYIVGSQKILVP